MGTATNSQIINRLDELEAKEGRSRPLELYRRLLDIQAEVQTTPPIVTLTKEAANLRLAAGQPLLEFGELAVDWAELKAVIDRINSLLAQYPDFPPPVSPPIGDLPGLVKAWFEARPMEGMNGNGRTFEFVLGAALKPVLTAHAEALVGFVEQEQWRRGFCPVCGGKPDFAFLDKDSGARWLMCSRCDARWLFQRLECPRCGNEDPGKLAYFTDESELYRLYVCESCRHYLKAIDLRRANSDVLLPLERVLTLHLDMQAQQSGYTE